MKKVTLKKKNIVSFLILLIFLVCMLNAVEIRSEAASSKAKKVVLTKTKLKLVPYRDYTLKLKNAKGKIVWRSSDKSVATVSSKGKVSTVAPGTCTITARNKKKNYMCVVQVLPTTVNGLKKTYSSSSKLNRGKIILAGSSSLDYWAGASSAFAPYEIRNMAIAGTTVTQWQEWYYQLIVKYKPSAVVIYVGSNDLGMGKTGRQTALDTRKLLYSIQKKLPKTPIYYISICPCESRPNSWEAIAYCNKYIKKYCSKKKNLNYIDIVQYFTKNGKPRASLFLDDKLHPNSKGYAIWKKVVANRVKRDLMKK